jgi:hypothetical protein
MREPDTDQQGSLSGLYIRTLLSHSRMSLPQEDYTILVCSAPLIHLGEHVDLAWGHLPDLLVDCPVRHNILNEATGPLYRLGDSRLGRHCCDDYRHRCCCHECTQIGIDLYYVVCHRGDAPLKRCDQVVFGKGTRVVSFQR